jgi:hypothetical protein
MKRLLLSTLLAVSAAASAATPVLAARISIIAPYRATQFEGSVMAVRGLAQVRENEQLQGTDVRLVAPDGRVLFTGFIPKLNAYAFPHVKALDGKEVVMYGVMEKYQGHGATQLIFRDQVQAWPVVPRQRPSA